MPSQRKTTTQNGATRKPTKYSPANKNYFDENKENRLKEGPAEDWGGEDEESCEDLKIGRKRRARQGVRKAAERKIKRERGSHYRDEEDKVKRYYSGSYFSRPVSEAAYQMSCQMNQDSTQFLWFWMLAITEMYLHKKISLKTYEAYYQQCRANLKSGFVGKSFLDSGSSTS
jgi:hypothetical protein